MDLCSGCGVIGLDLKFHEPRLRKMDFIEVQEIYLEYFKMNHIRASCDDRFQMHLMNYSELQTDPWKDQIDLIVSNPPYFRVGQGKLSPSDFKNRCRFYMDSDFQTLLRSAYFCLKNGGEAFFLVRGLHDHKIDVNAEISSVLPQGSFRWIEPIRGTEVLHVLKLG